MAVAVSFKFQQDMDLARRSYINEEHYKAIEIAKEIEVVFRTVYQGLRIITRLPGVREIDRHGKNFSSIEYQTVQEIYRSIADIISLSEIYIVPRDFNPGIIDEVTGNLEEPIVMFDDLIAGRRGSRLDGNPQPESPSTERVEEVEIYEYQTLAQQIKTFNDNFPTESILEKSPVPVAMASPEIITCDNSFYSTASPAENNARMGFIYALPFYDKHGVFKGVVSGTMLSRVFLGHLPNNNYVLANQKYGYLISKRDFKNDPSRIFYANSKRDPHLVYSEVIPLDIPDIYGGWYLWVGIANDNFTKTHDVVVAREFMFFGYLGCLILMAGVIAGYFIINRKNLRLSRMNKRLVEQQEMLGNSRNLIKKFSGRILSIREAEMKNLGRDLHDMVGSMAISLNARFSVVEAGIKNRQLDKALINLQDSKKLLENMIDNFKKITVSLRPPQLETVGLSSALKSYCMDITSLAGLELDFQVDIQDDRISEDMAIALYRVVQEALTNIVKHAKAKRCKIQMFMSAGLLYLIIGDDGIGLERTDIEFHSQHSKMGLLGIRERVESFGGDLRIDSSRGEGTEYCIVIPLPNYAGEKR